MKRPSALALLVLLVVLATGCNGSDNPTAVPDPEPVPVPTVTETFTGALGIAGASCHFFEIAQAGGVEMSITSLAPLETLTLGLGIGLPDDTNETGCSLVVTDTSVRKDQTFLAVVNTVGTHCVCVFDVGNIFEGQNVTYSLDVEHP